MNDTGWKPPKVWKWDAESGGRFANINRPISGATHDKDLPVGKHPLQLYSLGSPNGQKVTVMLEELLELGHSEAEYDAWLINIMEGDQFSSGFVEINPNSKIPAMVDRSGPTPFRIFESCAILLHLSEKCGGALMPSDPASRAEVYSWVMWQMGTAPWIGGGFGHFYAYAPEKFEYPINRYAMEVKRIFHVADTQLGKTQFIAGDEFTLADVAVMPWLRMMYRGEGYDDAATFLSLDEYVNVGRWLDELDKRPAVQRGLIVNKSASWGAKRFLRERHDASDFENKVEATKPDGTDG